MNTDDFEKRMQRLPMRPVPPTWRADILRAAREARRSQTAPERSEAVSWWRALFWPSPAAWAGVAAVWALILGLNYSASTPEPTLAAVSAPLASPAELRMALAQQRRLAIELLELTPPTEAESPKPSSEMRPRSDSNVEQVCV